MTRATLDSHYTSFTIWWGSKRFRNWSEINPSNAWAPAPRKIIPETNFVACFDQRFKCSKVDSKIQRFKDRKIQRFKDSKIQRFKDSKIQRFKDSKVQRFKDSKVQRLIQRFKDSKVQRFKDSKIQRFKYSKIDSKIQRFKGSKIQRFKDSKIDSKIQSHDVWTSLCAILRMYVCTYTDFLQERLLLYDAHTSIHSHTFQNMHGQVAGACFLKL